MLVYDNEIKGYREQNAEEIKASAEKDAKDALARQFALQNQLWRANHVNTIIKAIMKQENCSHAEAVRLHKIIA